MAKARAQNNLIQTSVQRLTQSEVPLYCHMMPFAENDSMLNGPSIPHICNFLPLMIQLLILDACKLFVMKTTPIWESLPAEQSRVDIYLIEGTHY